jgi:hypothetical protein
VVSVRRYTVGPGQNDRDAQAKATFLALSLNANDQAQGQHFGLSNTLHVWGMGDVFAQDNTVNLWGGLNASGDEGQGVLRLVAQQTGPAIQTTIASVPAQSTCTTTLTQAVTKNVTVQAVTVASTAGCAVNDRVVIDQGTLAFSKPRMEIVKLTAVDTGASTISGQFRHNHVAGDTVVAARHLVLGSGGNLGAGRYIVNLTSPAYTTGVVTSIGGPQGYEFTGTGTAWSPTMVGGNALIPGCISLAADDVTTAPFTPAQPLRGWFGIWQVTDATHLNIVHSREAKTLAEYSGNGPGAGAYTVRACARILEVANTAVWLEPTTFAWTVGDTVAIPHSVDLNLTGVVRAQASFHSPNANLYSIYAANNFGSVPVNAALSVGGVGGAKNFRSIIASTSATVGPILAIQGKSDTGQLIQVYTEPGDRKYVDWRTNTEALRIGADDATGQGYFEASGPAMWHFTDTSGNYNKDVKLRSPILARRLASGGNPGATFGSLELVCGTTAGTARLIAYAGTSTTPVTIVDNIGAGVTGCP